MPQKTIGLLCLSCEGLIHDDKDNIFTVHGLGVYLDRVAEITVQALLSLHGHPKSNRCTKYPLKLESGKYISLSILHTVFLIARQNHHFEADKNSR
jgi:hypothetical protein